MTTTTTTTTTTTNDNDNNDKDGYLLSGSVAPTSNARAIPWWTEWLIDAWRSIITKGKREKRDGGGDVDVRAIPEPCRFKLIQI